jgi:NAD(P)-dependent dehydrogenase (short-subunit alcohol dehydrogenase family)
MRLKNKLAVITAAASGMGRAGVELFAREGAKVAAVDINPDALAAVVEKVRAAGGEAFGVVADLTRPEDCKRFVNEAAEKLGGLDVLWNHAGMPGPVSVEDLDLDEYQKSLTINLTSGILASGEAIRHMRKRGGGSIVFTASTSGLVGSPFSPIYSTEKFGVVGLAKSMALRYGAEKIRVNAVCPGLTDTAMRMGFLARPGDENKADDNQARYLGLVALGRLAQPEEMAHAALWLASDDASFVTGVALPVDGGYTAR